MFIIVGWGRKTNNDLGPTYAITCPNCGNKTVWHLLEHTRWVTLFFFPLFPYQSKHFLFCPVCTRGAELEGQRLQYAKYRNAAARSFPAETLLEAYGVPDWLQPQAG